MKFRKNMLFLLGIMLTMLLVLPASAGTTNILSNSGFESGSGTNAYSWTEDGEAIRTSSDSYSGSYSMLLHDVGTIIQDVNIDSDDITKITFYVKGNVAGTDLKIYYRNYVPGYISVTFSPVALYTCATSGDWLACTITNIPDNKIFRGIGIQLNSYDNPDAYAYIDNFEVLIPAYDPCYGSHCLIP